MKLIHLLAASALLSAPLSAQLTIESFETYPMPVANFAMLTTNVLDDTTVEPGGIGPNLVAPGVTFSTSGAFLQWNGNGYFGQTSQNICGSGTDLEVVFDPPVTNMTCTLHVFTAAPEVAVVEYYDGSGNLLATLPAVNISVPSGIGLAYTGIPLGKMRIVATVQPSSPIIDNLVFGGPDLEITGTCGTARTLTVGNLQPLGPVAIAYGPAGNFTIPSGPCAGLNIAMATPTLAGIFTADAGGNFTVNFNPPAGLCGLRVQAVDMTTCQASQVAFL
ncbi:MAG: hypothetical protein ACPG31_13895 [Planctomycetota bacterium]